VVRRVGMVEAMVEKDGSGWLRVEAMVENYFLFW